MARQHKVVNYWRRHWLRKNGPLCLVLLLKVSRDQCLRLVRLIIGNSLQLITKWLHILNLMLKERETCLLLTFRFYKIIVENATKSFNLNVLCIHCPNLITIRLKLISATCIICGKVKQVIKPSSKPSGSKPCCTKPYLYKPNIWQ